MITTARLRQRLRYVPETGELIWLVRPAKDCALEWHTRRWNTLHAGNRAGTINGWGYRIIKIDGRIYRTARLIWQIVTGEIPSVEVDHWNLDHSDDRWDNLRLATHSQNGANKKRGKNNTSGFKGVSPHHSGRFLAQCKHRHLGYFDTPEEAHAAYMAAAIEAYGDFARAQ
jgi:hypothetical protein